jgi:UTP--glucose-1-phosphate uridylyltransferase
MQKIKKAIIPVAGFGTRFLPWTKANPKEMLPIVDKPVIQYIIEEAVESGIEEIILITGQNKRAIEDHFDYSFELEERLKAAGKIKEYQETRDISDLTRFVYIRQKEPLGNGHAVLCAKDAIGNEPFLVSWGDDFFKANPPRFKQMISAYQENQGSILSAIRTKKESDADKYSFAKGEEITHGLIKMNDIIEKPGSGKAPSDYGTVSSFVLTPKIFEILENLKPGKSGEIWLVDAVKELIKKEPVYALEIKNGKYYDCGNKIEYLKAVVDFALEREDVGKEFKEYLKELKIS